MHERACLALVPCARLRLLLCRLGSPALARGRRPPTLEKRPGTALPPPSTSSEGAASRISVASSLASAMVEEGGAEEGG